MALRELLLQLGVEVDKKGVKNADNAIAGIKKAAIALGAIFVTGKLAQGVKGILELGSSAAETTNVIEAVFEKNAEAVEDWSKRQSEAMGRSRFELREMAASTGAIIGPTLKSADAAADMATQVAQLAVDLGSFFNANDADALTALQAGLIGSSEPMLKFGVTMNVAALEAFRLEKGLTKTFQKMSAAEKQQLRFNFIMDKTVKAQGDAAKTSAGFANATKALRAAAKDALTVVGIRLLPTFEKLLAVLIPLTKQIGTGLLVAMDVIGAVIDGLDDIIQAMIGTWNELDGTIEKLIVGLGLLGIAFTLLGRKGRLAALEMAANFAIAAFPIILITALVAILLLAVQDFIVFMRGGDSVIGRLVDRFREWVDEMGGIGGIIKKIFSEAFQFIFNISEEKADQIITAFQGVWAAIRETFSAIGDFFGTAFDVARKAVEKIIEIARDIIEEVKGLISDTKEFLTGGQTRADKAEEKRAGQAVLDEFATRKKRILENQRALDALASGIKSVNVAGVAAGFNPFANASNTSQSVVDNSQLTVNVDASGQTNPDAIAESVSTKINRTPRNRQTLQSFVTQAAK